MSRSPFPGMDPYLEAPAFWPGVHARLISSAAAILNTLLPEPYVADIGERLYLVEPERGIYPDVVVVRPPNRAGAGSSAARTAAVDPAWNVRLEREEITETFIRIVTTPGEEVVTVIEVLCPANKAAGSGGRETYRAKQREVLTSDAHLIEIDLLRTGEHTVAAPEFALERMGSWNYLACLHRTHAEWEFQVWSNPLEERLPRIAVPLKPGHEDVALDLQQVFDRAYTEGNYRRRLDYTAEPVVALSAPRSAWADQLLRGAGLRAPHPI